MIFLQLLMPKIKTIGKSGRIFLFICRYEKFVKPSQVAPWPLELICGTGMHSTPHPVQRRFSAAEAVQYCGG